MAKKQQNTFPGIPVEAQMPQEPEPEQTVEEAVEEIQEPEPDYSKAVFVCIQKCYFHDMLWNVDDETGYIPGIEKHCDPEKPDFWFEMR